jgi:hypothetical protein
MRGDGRCRVGHARRMILVAEHGLRFASEDDHCLCVEYPDLVMLRGGRYRVNDGTLAAGLPPLNRVGISYMVQRGMAASGPHRPRKYLTQLAPSPIGVNVAATYVKSVGSAGPVSVMKRRRNPGTNNPRRGAWT